MNCYNLVKFAINIPLRVQMMQQNLMIDKIYSEIDMIRMMAVLFEFAIVNDFNNTKSDSFSYIFKDIESRCFNIAKYLDEMENVKKPIDT